MVHLKLEISSSRGYQCIMQTPKTYYASLSGKVYFTDLSFSLAIVLRYWNAGL